MFGLPLDYITNIIKSDHEQSNSRLIDTKYVHVSGLLDLCLRQRYLSIMYHLSPKTNPSFSDLILWKTGKSIESLCRDTFIERVQRENILGRWVCNCGQSDHIGLYEKRVCNSCNSLLSNYDEYPLTDDTHRITGRPDLVFRYNDLFYVIEIKSMAKSMFDDLTSPITDHILQACMYRKMLSNQYNVADKVIVIYFKKEYVFGYDPEVIKEFHCDPKQYAHSISVLYKTADKLKYHIDNDIMPERTVCDSPESRYAKKCLLRDICFSLRKK